MKRLHPRRRRHIGTAEFLHGLRNAMPSSGDIAKAFTIYGMLIGVNDFALSIIFGSLGLLFLPSEACAHTYLRLVSPFTLEHE